MGFTQKHLLIFLDEANGALCPVLGRICAGHYHDGDHHRHGSWYRLGLHLQEVSNFSSGFPVYKVESDSFVAFLLKK